jgi:uncharacterized delta-60 repeat protein
MAIARFNANGSLDNTYYREGDYGAIAIQSDDKIVVAGRHPFRFNTDLSVDTSFSQAGTASNGGNSIAIQSNNKILVGGGNAIVRYNTNGNLDSTFDGDGIQIIEVANDGVSSISDIAIYENKLYAAGTIRNGSLGSFGYVARYLLDGEDSTSPVVSLITFPDKNNFLAPANIFLRANATDADGSIAKVEFYKGSVLLHTETVFPYGFNWRNVGLNEHFLSRCIITYRES